MFIARTSLTGSFIAVAHSRPSSAATLFYRDFVGQEIKPEWKRQVTEAFETAQIVDTAAPDWYEETPTRVRAVPVLRRLSASGSQVTNTPIAVPGSRPNRRKRLPRQSMESRSRHAIAIAIGTPGITIAPGRAVGTINATTGTAKRFAPKPTTP